MSLPDGEISSKKMPSSFLNEEGDYGTDLNIDYELGGIALKDPSQGLMVQVWKCVVEDFFNLVIYNELNTKYLLFKKPYAITNISFTFDQNMNPFAAFKQLNEWHCYWYNSVTAQQEFFQMEAGITNVKATLDDKRTPNFSNSDIILSYTKNNNLYYRLQRDRYEQEYLVANNCGDYLYNIGMTKNNRLQWTLSR